MGDSKINDGGPAFPYSALEPDPVRQQLVGSIYADNQGMTLRQYYAAQALMGFITADRKPPVRPEYEGLTEAEALADQCFFMADAMIKRGGR